MWKRSVELSRYAVGGAMGIGEPGVEAVRSAGELGRQERGKRRQRRRSGRVRESISRPWAAQARTSARPRLRGAIDQAATRRDR